MPLVCTRWLAAPLLALCLAACHERGAIELSVVDDRGETLAEVPIRADGELVARSDADRSVKISRERLQGRAALHAECPEAYRPASPQTLTQQRLPRQLQFVCRPRLRTLGVVAYAPSAPGAALRADAQSLGRVAADGTLHAVLRRPPGAAVQLSLDTDPPLTQLVKVRDRDEIVFVDGER